MRAYYFDAAGNHLVVGLIRSAGMSPVEAFGILRGNECKRLSDHAPDIYAILHDDHGQLRARFWNPDGSSEDFCGNALRCVPLVLSDVGEPHERVTVHTPMGPVVALHLGPGVGGVEIPTRGFTVVDEPDTGAILVGVGTPHRVCFVSDLDDPSLDAQGQRWTRAALPVAATFVRVEGQTLCVRSFERGVVRETGSSGTAAIAACLARAHRAPDDVREFREVSFPGDHRLRIRFAADGATVTLYGACRLEFGCDMVTEGERLAKSG